MRVTQFMRQTDWERELAAKGTAGCAKELMEDLAGSQAAGCVGSAEVVYRLTRIQMLMAGIVCDPARGEAGLYSSTWQAGREDVE